MNFIFWFFIIALAIIFIFVISMYNTLISRRNGVKYAYSSIDALLKKRFDLIPNLVSAAKEYMNYEKNLLNQLTELRTSFKPGTMNPQELDSLDAKSAMLIKGIFAVAENYPDLKASQNILQLQAALNEVEEQISAARRAYNAAVMQYNNSVNHFPSNMIANAFNFQPSDSFSIPEGERQSVDVKALFKN